ncbi:hypothetical protein TCE0_034f10911 [Talaromyces pinophilus]|uniref:Xylanolytic transcriptional activator regulatory domain-containing protein n=1 Tax=Talaromyces pinophilus TaxID=128442 RepID=A0A6V8HE24_TALPI|nr:hypothetical protein TCE0_034f10911 [Talaromyces pinophilus]
MLPVTESRPEGGLSSLPGRHLQTAKNAVKWRGLATGAECIESSAITIIHARTVITGKAIAEDVSEVRRGRSQVPEIERLEERIRELEEQLQKPSNPVNDGIRVTAALSEKPNSQWIQAGPGKLREGIYTTGVQSQRSQWYGLLSNFYYISRLRSDLTIALQQPQSDDNIQPNSASQIFVSPTSSKPADSSLEETALSADLGASGGYLTPTQEDYFLSLFWESYHCTFQILDEGEFREHYRSLWKTSSSTRKPSPLVDIILAICMQYGLAFLPREVSSSEPKTVVDGNDATIAGRWYYHRSQMLLNSQLESPSMMTLQCQILAVKYLCNASYQNMAYSGLATAIRTAHLLGVHLEPPVDMLREQRELRKRILTGSEILSGMHEAFHFQWNATVSLIGFILAYPLSPLTPEVRENINNAIAVFETFGKHFAVGASAANVTRNLVAKADYLTERFHARLASLETSNTSDLLHSYLGTMSVDNMDLSAQSPDFLELMNFPMSGTTDLGFSLDPFAGLEQFYSGSANDAWVLDQN